jgi:hypothetical protein
MKKTIAISFITLFSLCLVAQTTDKPVPAGAGVKAVNPNIERMRIVNEKIAAEKAKQTKLAIRQPQGRAKTETRTAQPTK